MSKTKSNFNHNDWTGLKNEIREILVHQAQSFKPISCGELCNKLPPNTLKPDDKALNTILGEISQEEHQKGNGMLSSSAGSKRNNYKPGKGFFHDARKLGHDTSDEDAFIKKERQHVHDSFKDKSILTI